MGFKPKAGFKETAMSFFDNPFFKTRKPPASGLKRCYGPKARSALIAA
jgi:hypothetical protein